MKILITGAGGQVGQALMRACAAAELAHVGLTHAQMDITDAQAVSDCLDRETPDYVINAAAVSDVTAAQGDAAQCYAINRDGAALLAKACHARGIALCYLSTDYVFSGQDAQTYTESDKPNPQNVYGNSKLEGENAVREYCPRHLIVRTSWLFSHEGNNFLTRVLTRAARGEAVRGVDDQFSCPTWTGHLAIICLAMLRQVHCNTEPALWGTYHYCDRGATTRFDFARAIVKEGAQAGLMDQVPVEAINSASLNNRAESARESVLNVDRIFYTFAIRQRGWRDGLKSAIAASQEIESRVA